MFNIINSPDGAARCWWPGDDQLYCDYHDSEWGRPATTDSELFEKVCLEGFQAGLSWITILRKRPGFREAFAQFDIDAVAAFGEDDVDRLVLDAGIVRHRGKIRSAIANASRARELREEFGGLAPYFEQWRSESGVVVTADETVEIPAQTEASTALSRDLRKRGWSFVGPTTMYAFMQSMGLVNDHLPGCDWHSVCEAEQRLRRGV